MAASTRSQVISLYKMMLKESSRFPSYNYRTYALRRVRDAFRANREVEDPKAVERLMEEGEQMLALIQRQVAHFVPITTAASRPIPEENGDSSPSRVYEMFGFMKVFLGL
uniref:Complex 1 LYR protein domain-containing protein n=1 Tax=Xiphophorus couchianus TaxID=32473 RepID=A0A3B5L0L5_9TELE